MNYRQLTCTGEPGLVFDIAALSDSQIGFYVLDVTRAGNNGIMAALLLRVMFNELLQKKLLISVSSCLNSVPFLMISINYFRMPG